jgi:nuclear GTP-binding protein
MLPFRESMVADLQERKRLEDIDKEKRRMSLKALAKDAQKRSDEFDAHQLESSNDWGKTLGEAVTSGARDNSKRAYYKEFRKVVDAADVILEVLDARDPLGCRTRQIEDLIVRSGHKRVILVLNKIDLVPREVVENWLKYLRNEFPTVAFKASTQNQRQNLSRSSVSTRHASDNLLQTSECLGADNLMKLLKNYCRNSKIKTNISVGVVGFPNVGKSSVINSLKRSKVCGVGSTPGLTKSTQEIHLDKNIKLIDSPGIVFGKMDDSENNSEVLLRNCVKVELIEDPVSAGKSMHNPS